MTDTLARLSQAVQMLATARTLDDFTAVRSMAQLAEEYARAQKLGDEAERHAREIRLRAARKAGEVLLKMREDGGRRRRGIRHDLVRDESMLPPTLDDLGISSAQSWRWQRLALVPDDVFDDHVADGWGEERIARHRAEAPVSLAPKAKNNGFTRAQSLRGLQQAAVMLQGLAEGLDGDLYGDWSRLFADPDAQPFFDILQDSLPLVNARLKRALRDRGEAWRTAG